MTPPLRLRRAAAPVPATLLAVLAAALSGCGGGGDPDASIGTSRPDDASVRVDSGGPTSDGGDQDDGGGSDDGGTPARCNPATQAGCGPGEKCAFIVDDVRSGDGHVGCAEDGTIVITGDCTAPDEAGTTDDCVQEGHCYEGVCREICDEDVGCPAGTCVRVAGVAFDLCLPDCDALTQNCLPGEGCYLVEGGAICADVAGGGAPGDACKFLNECDAGAGCFDDGVGAGRCLAYCDFGGTFDEGSMQPCCGPGCGGTIGCAGDEICAGVADEPVVGVCVTDEDAGCDCSDSPPCPT
jgi:hypothetical protein